MRLDNNALFHAPRQLSHSRPSKSLDKDRKRHKFAVDFKGLRRPGTIDAIEECKGKIELEILQGWRSKSLDSVLSFDHWPDGCLFYSSNFAPFVNCLLEAHFDMDLNSITVAYFQYA